MKFSAKLGAFNKILLEQGWKYAEWRRAANRDEVEYVGARACGHSSGFALPTEQIYATYMDQAPAMLKYMAGDCTVCASERETDDSAFMRPDQSYVGYSAADVDSAADVYKKRIRYVDPAAFYGIDRSTLPPPVMTPAEALTRLADVIHVAVAAWAGTVVDDTMRFAAALELDLDKPPPQAPKRAAQQAVGAAITYARAAAVEELDPEWHNQLEIDPWDTTRNTP